MKGEQNALSRSQTMPSYTKDRLCRRRSHVSSMLLLVLLAKKQSNKEMAEEPKEWCHPERH